MCLRVFVAKTVNGFCAQIHYSIRPSLVIQYTLMNIAVDLTQIPCNKTGIGIYALNLVKELIRLNRQDGAFSFYFFAQDDDPQWQELIQDSNSCHLFTINSKYFRKLPLRFLFEQFLLPRECRKLKIDTIFSFHYTMPYFTRIKRAVTIPDMTFYLFPHMHQPIKRFYFKSLIPFSLRRSDKVVTISDSTKTDLLDRFKQLDAEKIAVIHLGVTPPAIPPQAPKHLENYSLTPKKYFLYLGTLEPRKNIPGIIEAFHTVTADKPNTGDLKLVIAGMKGWFYDTIFETVKKYRLEDRVVFTGYADDAVKQSLLANAFLFVYPSFYEGFGLPILEAMVYGVPVITGNVSSLPEVAGDAALLIDPGNDTDIAGAMQKLLDDGDLYKTLSERSIHRARTFSWKNTAKKTLELFRSMNETATNDH